MKIDLSLVVTDPRGEPMKAIGHDGKPTDEKMTLANALEMPLLTPLADDGKMAGPQKIALYKLFLALQKAGDGELELTATSFKLIEDRVAGYYASPFMVGRVTELMYGGALPEDGGRAAPAAKPKKRAA